MLAKAADSGLIRGLLTESREGVISL